jgi:ferritin-like metal-binding protein YciE
VLDAGLIGAAQKVEHYEIAGYGTARTFARHLGETQAAMLLDQTLQEEGDTDHKLTRLAEQCGINQEAMKQAA